MKTHSQKWKQALVVIMSAMSIMACSKDKGSTAPVAVTPVYPGIGGACTNCGNFAQGPVLFQGAAASPNTPVFQLPGVQVVADAQGYQMAASSGLRPLVNGSYPAAVSGTFRLTQPISCGGQMTYPAGDYNIQMLQMGQMQNGVFYAPAVNLVSPTGAAIQPAAVMMVAVDANLDNVIDRGSMIAVGFCGKWLDMNTL